MNSLRVVVKHSSRQFSTAAPVSLSTNWEPLRSKLSDARARHSLDSLKQTHNNILAEGLLYQREPEAINFAHYRELIKNKDLVDALEDNYRNLEFPDIKPSDCYTEGRSLESDLKPTYNRLSAEIQDSVERIEELKEFISLLEQTRTTKDTSIDEVAALHPEIVDEIDDEIAALEWEKDAQN
ncbi:hypothetical protein LEN26_010896 [Aphanomyces euteiches]|nr:hypothetical protein AeMF1_018929 [Aphanomyces euteiches]KAH9120935.1 hypothetical protein LEN26_010896 [Aphanomyces euteiches]KAH9181149.1 hypothetical protein AeNC1_016873 [Aphanomyces euteiches]